MNRSFDERVSREHFVVLVEKVNPDGIWGVHPHDEELISFFSMNHVISIHREHVLNPENPEHAQMIDEYEKKTGKKVESDLVSKKLAQPPELLPVIEKEPASQVDDPDAGDATFVDIENLERLAESTKRTFDAYDLLGKHKSL